MPILTKCDGDHALTTLCTDRQCWQGDDNPMVRQYEYHDRLIGERKAYADAILTHLAGIVPTPERGYLNDGGPSLAKSDLNRFRSIYQTTLSLVKSANEGVFDIASLKDTEAKYTALMEQIRDKGDQWDKDLIKQYMSENDLLSNVCKDLTAVRDQLTERLKDSLFRLIDLQNENAALRQNAELAKQTRGFSVGDTVMVYDRYRFAIPLKAIIRQFSGSNDGVRVMLSESNNAHYPVGNDTVWVHQDQLRHAE